MKIGNGSPLSQAIFNAVQQQPAKFADLSQKLNLINAVSPKQSGKLDTSSVEKHISDYKSGNGNLSKETAADISGQEDRIYQTLAQEDLSARIKFSEYLTALTYDQRARYVENLGDVADSSSKLTQLVKTKV